MSVRNLLLVVALLVVASAFGWWWRAREGRTVAVTGRDGALGADLLGTAPGARVTFVQMSSTVCAPCRSTATVLGRIADDEPGVVHVELDVAEHLDLARRLDVLRTPTTLVLDPGGRLVATLNGALTRPRALAALAELAPTAAGTSTH